VSKRLYFTVTITLFTIQAIFAILIDDITIIFGFIASISESMINFLLPSTFYIVSCYVSKKKPNPLLLIGSIVYLGIGITLFFMVNYHNVKKIYDSYNGSWY
jgi:hypothetical protein